MSDLKPGDRVALLPCPFCGSSDLLVFEDDYGVNCRACHAQVLSGGTESDRELWNRRAPLPAAKPEDRLSRDLNTLLQYGKAKPEDVRLVLVEILLSKSDVFSQADAILAKFPQRFAKPEVK